MRSKSNYASNKGNAGPRDVTISLVLIWFQAMGFGPTSLSAKNADVVVAGSELARQTWELTTPG